MSARAILAAVLLVAAGAPPVLAQDAPECGRECLEGFIDAYLEALAARDPNLLPLTPDVKFTENGVELPLGDAAWGTVTSIGDYRIVLADLDKGEVAYMGVIVENDDFPAIATIRLRVEDMRISEIETVWARSTASAERLEAMGAPDPRLMAPLDPDDTPTREKLVAISNMYFTGLQDNDGHRFVPFSDDCIRRENGNQANSVEMDDSAGGYPAWLARMSCDEQWRTGYFRVDTDLRERRFRVVDTERGLALAFVFFDHDATVREFELANGEIHRPSLGRPQTWQIAELFKVENGEITRVEAILNDVPYGMGSGWYDCSGVQPRPCIEPGPPARDIRLGHDYPENR